MRRIAVVLGLSALLGLAPLVAHAQISIAGTSEVMDISLRDAEIGEVLIALFNTTNGKYQLQIGNGVVGRIARLQLTQTPFERALDAVLGTEYSYTKTQLQDGAYLYKISGRQTVTPATPAVGTRTTGMLAPPSGSVGAAATGGTGTATGGFAGATDFSTTLSWKTATTPGAATGGALGGGAAAGAPAASENSYVKLIRLSNLSVESFCDALGVESMPWISSLGQNDNYNDDYNNNDYYNNNNNNNYNNNNYNNNNYNDNNNRTNRNTRNTRNNRNYNNNID